MIARISMLCNEAIQLSVNQTTTYWDIGLEWWNPVLGRVSDQKTG